MVVVVIVSRRSQEIEYNGPPPQQRVRLSQGLDRFPFSCLNNSNQATFHSSTDFLKQDKLQNFQNMSKLPRSTRLQH